MLVYRRDMESTIDARTGRTMVPESIERTDLRELVQEHFEEMIAMSAPEVSGALDVVKFSDQSITLFAMREDGRLLGCGALKDLGDETAEIKTMRVVEAARGQGIGGLVLDYLIDEARRRGNWRVYLETGSEDFFIPARALYRRRGFVESGPFGHYKVDPHSVFMLLDL